MVNKSASPSNDGMPNERRGDDRTIAVYRPVLIETDQTVGFCLLRNLSPGGMMGVVYTRFAADQRVSVHFQPNYCLSGLIAWADDQRIGVQFDQEIEVEKVLHILSRKTVGEEVNRAPRLQIQCSGVMTSEGRTVPMTVQDISQRGVKVFASPISRGEEVVVRLEGLAPRKATVQWTKGEMAGLSFLTPLPFEDLAEWVILRQSK